jgi:hypothetical protein
MNKFTSPLKIQYHQRKGHRAIFSLLEAFTFYSDEMIKDQRVWIIVPTGFLSDGASTPRWTWIIFPPWSDYGQACVLHDFLLEYRTYTDGINEFKATYKQADMAFKEALEVLDVAKWKVWAMYNAVRIRNIFKGRY